jgi:hypothetical protein
MKSWRVFLASVWLVNGLICKLLNLVPRHEAIVARILGEDHATLYTKLIGVGEIAIGIWVLTGTYRRLNVIIQMALILVMNVIEFFLASDLLLWGRLNLLFAILFVLFVAWIEFWIFSNSENSDSHSMKMPNSENYQT